MRDRGPFIGTSAKLPKVVGTSDTVTELSTPTDFSQKHFANSPTLHLKDEMTQDRLDGTVSTL